MIIKEKKINTAIENLKKGKTIIYPTDTLYGLGADATNTEAVNKINNEKSKSEGLGEWSVAKDVFNLDQSLFQRGVKRFGDVLFSFFALIIASPLFVFETIGNGVDIGIVPDGDYWVRILNTRPNRLDFTFRIELSEINQ